MIYITGDTHADWMSRLNTKAFPEQKEMTKNDFVIILGDFGIWDNSKSEKHNLDWLEEKPFTTLFIDGNHENYDILDNIEIQDFNNTPAQYVRPSVIHLMRGEVYNINNKKFFAFGGAQSHDIQDGILDPTDKRYKKIKTMLEKTGHYNYRVDHISWWAREMPNEQEYQNGLANLNRFKNKVDFILTHAPSTRMLRRLDTPPYLYQANELNKYLDKIQKNTEYQKWFFGHMHVNKNLNQDNAIALYEQIIRID